MNFNLKNVANIARIRIIFACVLALAVIGISLASASTTTPVVPQILGSSGPVKANTWVDVKLPNYPVGTSTSLELSTTSNKPFALASREDSKGRIPQIVKTSSTGTSIAKTTADASITNEHPNTNYGKSPWLFLESTRDIRSYLQFPVPPRLLTTTTTRPETNRTYVLHVYVLVSNPVGFDVRLTKSNWTESGTGSITYQTRPAYLDGTTETTSTSTTTTSSTSTTSTSTSTTTTSTTLPPSSGALAIKVQGPNFVDGSGRVVQLRGVSRAGMEYACIEAGGWGFITDAGTGGNQLSYADTVARSLLTWDKAGASGHAINAVRIPLNEQCWLGINGSNPAYSGANYKAFLRRLVKDLTDQNMYVILDLHRYAPGSFDAANSQDVAPNRDHSITFWNQVAAEYKTNPAVMFDLANEPRIACHGCANTGESYAADSNKIWTLYRDGGTYTYGPNEVQTWDGKDLRNGATFQIAGTQELTNAIRSTGSKNVILIPGLGWANSLDHWSQFKPNDPENQIGAIIHTYTNSGANVNNLGNLDGQLNAGGVPGNFPLFVGEFGENMCSGTGTGFHERTISWADSHGYSYAAWGWDQGEGCNGPSLVSNNDTGATFANGAVVKSAYQARQGL